MQTYTLNSAIRGLRASLIDDLTQHVEAVYHLGMKDAAALALEEATAARRGTLLAWIAEQRRAGVADPMAAAVEEVAATWLHRLVVLRQLEAQKLRKANLITGGWSGATFSDLSLAIEEVREDAPDEGFALWLELVMDEVALDLPDLFGPVGLTPLVPLPAHALRSLVERLNDPGLSDAWSDEMTLGWVFQYWNDPAREALDAHILDGGKIAPDQIASKTQMFTDRYMVEWMVQNTLNPFWLAICQRNAWTPDVLRDGTLDALEQRRGAWREARAAETVPPNQRLELHTDAEQRWAWYVPRPLPPSLVTAAPDTLRDLRILEPACGSGHFLVLLLHHLAPLYHEEARHRGEAWTPHQIVAWILQRNLHGFDLDPRAVQVATAALWLQALRLDRDARMEAPHLYPVDLTFARLPKDDPARVELVSYLATRGADPAMIEQVLDDLHDAALHGAGSLLRITPPQAPQLNLLDAPAEQALHHLAAASLHDLPLRLDFNLRRRLEAFTRSLGFVEYAQDATYHIVLGNPPYLGAARIEESAWLQKHYPQCKADLFAALLLRAAELTRHGGLSALLTMRGWMFIKQFEDLRSKLLAENGLHLIGDLDTGAFEEIGGAVVSVAITIISRRAVAAEAYVLQPTPPNDAGDSSNRTARKAAALLAQANPYTFSPQALHVIEGHPLIYWWTPDFLKRYGEAEKLGEASAVRQGLATSNNARYLRQHWELQKESAVWMPAHDKNLPSQDAWVPFIAGSAGQVWFDHSNVLINWLRCGLELKVQAQNLYGSYTRTIKNISYYFTHGVAFSMIGDTFSARAHRYRSIFGNKGSSVFPEDIPSTLCLMNSRAAREIMESLNPGIGFEVGDVNRLPVWPIPDAQAIYDHLEQAFTEHEEARESSIEFRRPGASPWAWAQGWAQRMVDRGVGEAWEAYAPEYEAASAWQHVSFGLGVALGRWCGEGGGVRSSAPEGSVGEGIVFVSSYEGRPDSLQHPACAPLREAWAAHGAAASGSPKGELGEWLRRSFFKDHHRASFDNRPIFWPLASARSSFVAWVSIHRLSATTLPHLLTDHLHPTLQALQAELQDLLARQAGASAKERAALDKRQAQLRKLEEELADFIAQVDACAHHGPPPPDRATPPREVDAPYDPHLDDGVMINSAALWPLLDPQWKDPKKWWKELATAQGRKDYDWARLAARYFPQRVAAKCAQDPSLAVAHGCFWRHHPDLARQWEARLQEELDDPDFRIDELGSDDARARILMQGATQEPTRSQGPADADADADFYSSPSRRAVGKLGTS